MTIFNELRKQIIESAESDEMKRVIDRLYKEKGENARGEIISDGSAMDA